MLYLNYQIHKILQSQYKLLINLFIVLIIYLVTYHTQITFCMTEGTDISVIAEAKPQIKPQVQLSNLEQLIHRNIDAYIGDKALIASQQEEIARLTKEVEFHEELLKAMDTEGFFGEIATTEYDATLSAAYEVCDKYNKSLEKTFGYE